MEWISDPIKFRQIDYARDIQAILGRTCVPQEQHFRIKNLSHMKDASNDAGNWP